VRRRKLFYQIYIPFTLVTLLSLLGAAWYTSRILRSFYLDETEASLSAKARLIAENLSAEMVRGEYGSVAVLSRKLGGESGIRVTVMLPDGAVIGDSEEEPDRMENHLDRPEILNAINKGTGVSTRFSHTLNKRMMYVAVPVVAGGRTIGIVRTAKLFQQ